MHDIEGLKGGAIVGGSKKLFEIVGVGRAGIDYATSERRGCLNAIICEHTELAIAQSDSISSFKEGIDRFGCMLSAVLFIIGKEVAVLDFLGALALQRD